MEPSLSMQNIKLRFIFEFKCDNMVASNDVDLNRHHHRKSVNNNTVGLYKARIIDKLL